MFLFSLHKLHWRTLPVCLGTFRTVIFVILIAMIVRKWLIARNAMHFVHNCRSDVTAENLLANGQLLDVVQSMSVEKPILIGILNWHVLNMTLNWFCNTQLFSDVHSHTLIVTLDHQTYHTISNHWPAIRIVHLDVQCLKEPFVYGDGRYQLFYLLRSQLANALIRLNVSFWMIQMDTFWRQSIYSMEINSLNAGADIIFDKAGKHSVIAGGYYLVKPGSGSRHFFGELARSLEIDYVPDNTAMTSLCYSSSYTKCAFIPFRLIANWRWLFADVPERQMPLLLQFDGETKLHSKLDRMRLLGFYFLDEDGVGCNRTSVQNAISRMSDGGGRVQNTGQVSRSMSQLQLSIYQTLIDWMYKHPVSKMILNRFVFPNAHFFMLTI